MTTAAGAAPGSVGGVGGVVVLTGASSGIGRALALELAARRWPAVSADRPLRARAGGGEAAPRVAPRLVLAARDEERLASVGAACRELGAEVLIVPTDVGDEAACGHLIERAVDKFGRIDVLLLNAGITMWARFEELGDLQVFEQLLRVNYFGSVWPTWYALPQLRSSRGQIVVVASLAGLTGVPARSGYAASKHALFGFFDSLRIELADSGVDITMIAPDFVRTETHQRAIGADGKPLGASPLAGRKIMTAETCARLTVEALERRQRLAILSLRGRLGRFVRLLAPGLIDRVARRAIEG